MLPPDDGMFAPDEKAIFQFKDRTGIRSVDPLATFDAFLEAIGWQNPADLFRAEAADYRPVDWPEGVPFWPDPAVADEAKKARLTLVKAISKAFDVPRLAEDPAIGIADNDLLRLYRYLVAFLNGVKKNTDASPASAPDTESTGG